MNGPSRTVTFDTHPPCVTVTSMRSPIAVLRDWSRSREAAAQLFAALQRARPGGIDIPKDDPEMAASLMKLLEDKKYGHHLTVVKNAKNLTLAFKSDVDPVLTSSLGVLAKDVVARPKEDLVNE